MNNVLRARAYIAKLPLAIAGQRGHAATFAAACRLVEFGLKEIDSWQLLSEWNRTHCQPLWSEKDLCHKLRDAFVCTSPKPHFTLSTPSHTAPRREAPTAAAKGLRLPQLNPGSTEEQSQLARLRHLARDGISLASEKGLLRFGKYSRRPSWFIVDSSGRLAQARRLDGEPWAPGIKALTLTGSVAAWPVGIMETARFPVIALVEGGPDLLAACAFIVAEKRESDCSPVAMLGGGARIHPTALAFFVGKRVRIFPHVDSAGYSAADKWASQLAEANADVDAFSFAGLRRSDGAEVNDLCDLAQINGDDFEQDRSIWNIFP